MGFVIHLQAGFQRSALNLLALLPLDHRHRRLLTLTLMHLGLGGQLALVAVGLPLPGGRPAACHQQQDDENHAAQAPDCATHDSTFAAKSRSATRSAWPIKPPLMVRVILANCPESASSLRPFDCQNQPATRAAVSGCSTSSG